MLDTRIVHGSYMSGGKPPERVEVVEYAPAGEWYVEVADDPETWRRPVGRLTNDESIKRTLELAAQRER